ncbi:hypothetical protein ACFL6D_01850 [Spirochaetota bacterium]
MKILKHILIYKNTSYYSAMPCITRIGDDYILVFRRAPAERTSRTHLCAASHNVVMRTGDHFLWDDRDTIILKDKYGLQDGNVFVQNDGTLCFYSFLWERLDEPVKRIAWRLLRAKGAYWRLRGIKLYIADAGLEQISSYRIRNKEYSDAIAVRGSMARLDNGEVLLPAYGIKKNGERSRVLIYSSKDIRSGFSLTASFHAPDFAVPYYEPTLVKYKKKALACFIRTEGELHIFRSADNGRTWRGPMRKSLYGYPHHVLPLRDGRFLLTYGRRKRPYGIYGVVFDSTFSDIQEKNKFLIRKVDSVNHGYPVSLEVEKGLIFTVYYLSIGKGPTHIAGTVYRM